MKNSIQKGFTLIELLVVIAIIGILAGILFVAIDPKKQTDKAKDARVMSAMAGIPTAVVLVNASDFSGACTSAATLIAKATSDAASVATACTANTGGFVFSVNLEGAGVEYCVDASGAREASADATNKKCS